MNEKRHRYTVQVIWTGNLGNGTASYRAFERAHEIRSPTTEKPTIAGSADPAFRGDPKRWNPEELLVAAISACHKLWYLHLCSAEGLVATDYVDRAEGTMIERPDGSGRFISAILRPTITFRTKVNIETAMGLHSKAHDMCFIANSLNFPVEVQPSFTFEET